MGGTRGTTQGTRGTAPGTRGTTQGTRGTAQGTRGTTQGTRGTAQGTMACGCGIRDQVPPAMTRSLCAPSSRGCSQLGTHARTHPPTYPPTHPHTPPEAGSTGHGKVAGQLSRSSINGRTAMAVALWLEVGLARIWLHRSAWKWDRERQLYGPGPDSRPHPS